MRVGLVLAALCAFGAFAAGPAGATRECSGFPACVRIVGPWVLTGADEVEFQLACPKKFVVAGLDAELSERGIDVEFRGALGAPVNPGITTSTSAVFLGRLVRGDPSIASFRPHIGCIPSSGSGQRVPTAYVPAPQSPLMVQLGVLPGTHRYVAACPARRRLAAATHAIGFYLAKPPAAATAASVHVEQAIRDDRLYLAIHAAPEIRGVHAIVQVDLVCG